ncbi:putative Universal stress protein UspA [Rhodospirillaceae bacterium LM-1]|nr:putative Universal stress protein UspA [Rhodospirillaceae bacterium LM-1]
MTIKSILATLDGGEQTTATLEAALALVKRLGVHADILHVRPDTLTEVPAIGDGMSSDLADALASGGDVRSDLRAKQARAVFDRVLAGSGIEVVAPDAVPPGASVSFIERTGRRHAVMARLGRVHDLILTGLPSDPRDMSHSLTMDALFETGRPVLVVPHQPPASLGKHIAVAWNGSRECARALGGATNFFAFADQVTVLTAESERTPRSVVPELVDYLKRHVAKIDTKIIASLGKKHLGGRLLLDAVKDCGADLLVMGAHKAGPLKRLMLGSATHEVLAQSHVPVLMGH